MNVERFGGYRLARTAEKRGRGGCRDIPISRVQNVHGSLQTRISSPVIHQDLNRSEPEAGSFIFGADRLDSEELLSSVDARTTEQGCWRLSHQISGHGFNNKYFLNTIAIFLTWHLHSASVLDSWFVFI